MGARYINADLVLESTADLSELSAALERNALFVLDARSGRTVFETSRESKNLEHTLDTILKAAEKLDPKNRQIWMSCSQRRLDIGFENDPGHFATESVIDHALLQRMAAVGVSLVITHYRDR